MARIGLILVMLLAQGLIALSPVAACRHADGTFCGTPQRESACCGGHDLPLPCLTIATSNRWPAQIVAVCCCPVKQKCQEAHLRLLPGSGPAEKSPATKNSRRFCEFTYFIGGPHDLLADLSSLTANRRWSSPAATNKDAQLVVLSTIVLRC